VDDWVPVLPVATRSRTTNAYNLTVDECMFANFIRTLPTCGSG
jgi:hypothetical protein